ncbi:MAG TPA: response regulator [Nitrospiraceae bacterium]|nr:response regulator [Nitrospiraceae bacterium]
MAGHEVGAQSAETGSVLLVVEGDVLVRMVLCEYLRECGYRVIEAADAEEALFVLQEPDLHVHIVLSEAQMPGDMDGFGLSRWVRSNKPGLHVILVGSPASATDAAADLCESGPMLRKPYEPQILLDRIKRLIAGRSPAVNGAETASPR